MLFSKFHRISGSFYRRGHVSARNLCSHNIHPFVRSTPGRGFSNVRDREPQNSNVSGQNQIISGINSRDSEIGVSNERYSWLSGYTPPTWWRNPSNQRVYMEWLGNQLGYRKPEDWYRVTSEDFHRIPGGRDFLFTLGHTPSSAVMSVFPEFNFLPWLFPRIPRGYFRDRNNRIQYLTWLKGKIGVSNESELEWQHFEDNHGSSLLRLYGGSPQKVVASINPENAASDFDEGVQRKRKPKGFWSLSIENQRAYLDSIGAKIGVQNGDLSPWYSQSWQSLLSHGLGRILYLHSNSPSTMLSNVYPEYEWKPWRFNKIPKGQSAEPEFIEAALSHIEKALSITSEEDWYRVSVNQLVCLGIDYVILSNGGLFSILKKFRPNYGWVESKFIGISHFAVKHLGSFLRELFPSEIVQENAEVSHNLTVSYLLSNLKIAIQYQTERDYKIPETSTEVALTMREDPELSSSALELGYTMVFVPFWWNRSLESLAATLLKANQRLRESMKLPESMKEIEITNAIPEKTSISLSRWRKSHSQSAKKRRTRQ